MPYDVEWKQGAIEDVTMLFDYIAENSSLWDAQNVTDEPVNVRSCLTSFRHQDMDDVTDAVPLRIQ